MSPGLFLVCRGHSSACREAQRACSFEQRAYSKRSRILSLLLGAKSGFPKAQSLSRRTCFRAEPAGKRAIIFRKQAPDGSLDGCPIDGGGLTCETDAGTCISNASTNGACAFRLTRAAE
jgi:hypothetical protein